MSLLIKQLDVGGIQGLIYDFECAGDTLPMHSHSEYTSHITIVAKGVMKVRGPSWERVYNSGAVIDFAPYQEHEFEAAEDNTRLVNIIKK
jgi:quercetin dioxygenase-like cupin family protein